MTTSLNQWFRGKRTASLEARSVLGFRGWAGSRVESLAGTCLVTQAGDARDHVLYAGDSFEATRRGRVVVYAVTDANVRRS